MLKVRLMGTKNDIVWFQKILQRHPKVEVLEISELYVKFDDGKMYAELCTMWSSASLP